MKIQQMPWAAIKHEAAFKLSEGVYHMADYRLAVVDQAAGQALLIEIQPMTKEKANNE
ncbi:MAG: hypothetical protein IH612_02115 [Desulfofustis sp.]|nr:hypothetical protein [Desulfofustis sp.]